MAWEKGQKAAINRQKVVTIERVTKSGRAVVGNQTFGVDGRERGAPNPDRRATLELLTTEILTEMVLAGRGRKASNEAAISVNDALAWVRRTFSSWGRRIPEVEDIIKAERLAATIRSILDEHHV